MDDPLGSMGSCCYLLAIDEIKAAIFGGNSPVLEAFNGGDPLAVKEELEELKGSEPVTFSYLFRETFIEAAIPEEIGKYIVALYFIFRKKLAGTRIRLLVVRDKQ